MAKLKVQEFADALTQHSNISMLHVIDVKRIIHSLWYLSNRQIEFDWDEMNAALKERNWSQTDIYRILGIYETLKECSQYSEPEASLDPEFLDGLVSG